MSREVQFSAIIRKLLEERRITRRSEDFLQEIGLSFSALSGYMAGTMTPRFDKLVELADFFEVPLDYLVYGAGPATLTQRDDAPALRYVDLALDSLQKKNAWHFHLYRRIAELLGQEMAGLVSTATEKAAASMEGNTMDCIQNRPETVPAGEI